MNLQMEKHIFLRIKGATVGLVKGEFSQEVYQGIKYPVFLEPKPMNSVPHREQIETISPLKMRANICDVLLYQTSNTLEKQNKKTNIKSAITK